MRKGFIFNHEFCVGCRACSAACMLENEWDFRSRSIFTANAECFRPDPVINISMACNHCNDPACLIGCPADAYTKDSKTGAVIIDPESCIGCSYCIWNCPYDAPKLNTAKGVIEKCHFCYHRLKSDIEPACSSSCPTGALSFGVLPEKIDLGNYTWFPEKALTPSLMIKGGEKSSGPRIIPEREPSISEGTVPVPVTERRSGDWSLIVFTFLVTVSAALSAASLFSEIQVNGYAEVSLVALAGLLSFFHLKSRNRAWRAILNAGSSPLSREIMLFILYSLMIVVKQFSEISFFDIVISVTGLLLVMVIDEVYFFPLRGRVINVHSGQSLLAFLQIVSFITGSVASFVFISVIRLIIITRKILKERRKDIFLLRFFRFAFLVIAGMILLLGEGGITTTVHVVFFSGEFADRVLFYADFKPVNIKYTLI